MLDRRFLSVSLTVQGIVNAPADNPTEGVQYIVGSNPAGVFAGEPVNSIARYKDSDWHFIIPANDGLEVLNTATGEILRYDGAEWIAVVSCSVSVAPVHAVIPSGNSLPVLASAGEAFLNTATAKLHTATGVNTWDTGTITPNGSRYASTTDFKIYQSDGNSLTATPILDGVLFFNKEEGAVYVFDAAIPALVRLSGMSAVSSSAVTEIHILTAEEVTAKSFMLQNSVASGHEANALLFISGVAQAAGFDFLISGRSVSWIGKGLENIELTAGDKVIVHYVKS